MGVERRRAGFRLPWTAEGEETSETAAAETNGADESARAELETPPGTETDASKEPSTTVGEPMTAASTSPAIESPDASASDAASESQSAEFLQSLVSAMRSVAESSRDASLAELRTAIDARIDALGTEAAERETDIRRKADTDLEAVGEWERAEIDRVRSESESKREAHRARLEQELAEHRTRSERAVEATRSRLAQHENELASFFSQLSEITDPAAFVAAAKRMPRAPELEGGLAAAATEAPAAEPAVREAEANDLRLAALGMPAETPADAADAEPPASAEESPAAEPGQTTDTSDVAPDTADVPPDTADVAADTAVPAGDTTESEPSTNGSEPPVDARLAERLAQLDQRLSGVSQPAATTATAAAPGAETSTAIVVKGLGSFGAITSFKQALERVEGVRGVTLSLGPTGEFVYRASHAGDFDLVAAIQTLEGSTATIENTDGTLVVTLSRAR